MAAWAGLAEFYQLWVGKGGGGGGAKGCNEGTMTWVGMVGAGGIARAGEGEAAYLGRLLKLCCVLQRYKELTASGDEETGEVDVSGHFQVVRCGGFRKPLR